MKLKCISQKLVGLFFLGSIALTQQISIERITEMPNMPTPYKMRNWHQVARGYDSLVFDLNLSGEYLPLIWVDNNSVNYPEHNRFGLHTVVGSPYPHNAEAINVLPAVIGATLNGIDKSYQGGYNWVLMCEEFFNNRPEENIYLNNFVGNSGHDWWYETMPNVFFYQLYWLYPQTGYFDKQLTIVADRWLAAVKAMGGNTTPWQAPYMNYRAWDFESMQPLASGVRQPEAAGAIGWLLYHAYLNTQQEKYRIGAEWCLEFLDNWETNPAYELQLPYGAYIAARMNAELLTDYNLEKLLNWCFTPTGNVRNWGSTLGNWGGYDCYGLIGEAKYDGYAFCMNGMEQFGALIPLVRYDDRFARTIAKWALNLANASRLFYTRFLPDDHQDSEEWSHEYDPNSYIAHEALREYALYTGISPYATGDFIRNNWGPTNLTLYGSSHVGILGGIIDTTSIPGILKLNLNKTDFFQSSFYPSFLYYNPHANPKVITLELSSENYDIYESVSNTMIKTNVTGTDSFSLAADQAAILVLLPPNSTLEYSLNRVLVNNKFIDYHAGQTVSNYPPRIQSLAAAADTILTTDTIDLFCTATDRDGDSLDYQWTLENDSILHTGPTIQWTAPSPPGIYHIQCRVQDPEAESDSATITLTAVEFINQSPVIQSMTATPQKIDLEAESQVYCHASDPDGDTLSFKWQTDYGQISGADSLITWAAPDSEGYYWLKCQVRDTHGATDMDSIGIIVRDLSGVLAGESVLYLPLNGNCNDLSGFGNHGAVQGATLTTDRNGAADSAYYFDGINDNITVTSNQTLNFQDAITLCFWMKPTELFSTREAYPISHGNWENRWKVSIIPEKRLRWTVKSTSGIKDLDSETILQADQWYFITTLYDGNDFEIYINAVLDRHSNFSGQILTTNIDLMIAQALPSNNNYNFKGILDEIRLYDTALTPAEIQTIYNDGINNTHNQSFRPDRFALEQNYPNPFNPQTSISFQLPQPDHVSLAIYDLSGRLIVMLIDNNYPAGYHRLLWDARQISSGIYFISLQTDHHHAVRKCIKLK